MKARWNTHGCSPEISQTISAECSNKGGVPRQQECDKAAFESGDNLDPACHRIVGIRSGENILPAQQG